MATAPAEPVTVEDDSPSIESLTSKLAEYEQRTKGFQTALNKKDEYAKALEAQLEELKTAGLSDDEREQLRDEKLQRENEKLRQENELLRLQSEYGDEMPYFQRLLSAKTAQEQLDVMRELRASQAAAATPAAAQEDHADAPDVLPNNPPRNSDESWAVLPDGTPMSEKLADAILSRIGPGGLLR